MRSTASLRWVPLDPHHIEELASRVCPASHLDELRAALVQPVEAGIGICVHQFGTAVDLVRDDRPLPGPTCQVRFAFATKSGLQPITVPGEAPDDLYDYARPSAPRPGADVARDPCGLDGRLLCCSVAGGTKCRGRGLRRNLAHHRQTSAGPFL